MIGGRVGTCCVLSVDPVAPESGMGAAALEASALGVNLGGFTGSGGGAAEPEAVDLPQSSAAQLRAC